MRTSLLLNSKLDQAVRAQGFTELRAFKWTKGTRKFLENRKLQCCFHRFWAASAISTAEKASKAMTKPKPCGGAWPRRKASGRARRKTASSDNCTTVAWSNKWLLVQPSLPGQRVVLR